VGPLRVVPASLSLEHDARGGVVGGQAATPQHSTASIAAVFATLSPSSLMATCARRGERVGRGVITPADFDPLGHGRASTGRCRQRWAPVGRERGAHGDKELVVGDVGAPAEFGVIGTGKRWTLSAMYCPSWPSVGNVRAAVVSALAVGLARLAILVSLAIVKLMLAVVCNVQPLLAVDELCTAALSVVEAMT